MNYRYFWRLNFFVILSAMIFLVIENGFASEIKWDEEPPPTGNFSLRKSQRPGAFYSAGSKILEPGQIQFATRPDLFKSTEAEAITSPSTLLFGTSKHTSVFIGLPMTLYAMHKTPDGGTAHVSGPGNMNVQGEYEVLHHTSSTDIQEAGLLFSIAAPTGKKEVTPHFTSYFLGGTYTHTWFDWIAFAQSGYDIFEGPLLIRPGNIFGFNTGIGRNLIPEAEKYNLLAFIEVSVYTAEASPLQRLLAHAGTPLGEVLSDGKILYISPSLWYSNKDWIFQLVPSVPIYQHWGYTSAKQKYGLAFSMTYTII